MTKAEREKQIQALKNLGLTDEEVAEVLADDEKIDKGEKLFELPEELKKGAKKARNAGNCKGYTKPINREKKVDNEKRFLIETLKLALSPFAENVEVTNPEREFTFTFKDRKFKIVLSCPRS